MTSDSGHERRIAKVLIRIKELQSRIVRCHHLIHCSCNHSVRK